jgi:hypothetical protein
MNCAHHTASLNKTNTVNASMMLGIFHFLLTCKFTFPEAQTTMPLMGFGPGKTFVALGLTATVIGWH